MSPAEAAKVMAVLATAYNRDVTEETVGLWFQSCLSHTDYAVAELVVERIVSEDQWFPAVARFNEVRRTVERGLEEPVQALPAAPASSDERERVKDIIDVTRRKLRGEVA